MQDNGLALQDILLSIADSVNEAQMQLKNMPPYDAFGRPNAIYQLPYLDFNLEVISEVRMATGDKQEKDSRSARLTKKTESQKLFFLMPSSDKAKSTINNSSSQKVTSTISGRFVAVMPNEGLPQEIISANATLLPQDKINKTLPQENNNKTLLQENNYKIEVSISYATGERVVGKRVEVNFDEQASLDFNNGIAFTEKPVFKGSKDGFTDKNGKFEIEVQIAEEDRTKTVVFVANSANIFTSLSISN